jgi:predicted transcriptional regulator
VIRHCSLFGRPPRILGWKSRSRELEAKLKQVASQTGKVPVEVVRELVASYLDHDQWFRQEVGKGLASLDQGKHVAHDDVRRQMDQILGS